MGAVNFSDFLRRLARQMEAASLADQSDSQLVERALAASDGAAFEAIVHRYGSLVYRVCWRVLQHRQDTEDSFQATFLVLAQKLQTVRKHASLASWLHGVAQRVAVKARRQSASRRRRESRAPAPEPVPPEDITWRDLRSALDAELGQLPENWRLPLILCYLEGRTQDEAAVQLGWSKSKVRRHLDRGRAALRRRLARRGITAPAALTAVLLSDCLASAALTAGVVTSTVDAAAGVLAGQTLAMVVSAKVAALTEGMVKAMFIAKLKTITSMVSLLGVVAFGGGLLTQPAAVGQQGQASRPAIQNPAPPSTGDERKEDQQPPKRKQGQKQRDPLQDILEAKVMQAAAQVEDAKARLSAAEAAYIQAKAQLKAAETTAKPANATIRGEVLKLQLAELSVSMLVDTDKQVVYLTSGEQKKGDATYRITDKTVVLRGDSTVRMKIGEIRPGDRITIELDKAGSNVQQLRIVHRGGSDVRATDEGAFKTYTIVRLPGQDARVRFPIAVNPGRASEIKRVHLWRSTDEGSNWTRVKNCRLEEVLDGFEVAVTDYEDGTYWFAVVGEDSSGRLQDHEHLQPQVKVRVQTSKGTKRSIEWRTDYGQARKEAAEKEMPLLLFFHGATPTADPAPNPETKGVINERYIPVMLDRESQVGQLMRIGPDPTTVVASFDGTVLETIVGGLDASGLDVLRRLVPLRRPAWVRLGLKLEPVPGAGVAGVEKVVNDFRGGMRVLEVQPDSPAATAKLRKGDILIGLQQWETMDDQSVSFVLAELNKQSLQSCRFVAIRGKQLLTGEFTLPAPLPPLIGQPGGVNAGGHP
jgi:RNA polymerase sigma factor (sigma-70 family)